MKGEIDRIRRHIVNVQDMTDLFLEAAATERKMPGVIRKRYSVAWPQYVPDPTLAYGYGEFEVRPGPANAAEISRYDYALELSQTLDADDAKMVWAVAHSAVRRDRGPAWSRVAKISGVHPRTLKKRFEHCMRVVWFEFMCVD